MAASFIIYQPSGAVATTFLLQPTNETTSYSNWSLRNWHHVHLIDNIKIIWPILCFIIHDFSPSRLHWKNENVCHNIQLYKRSIMDQVTDIEQVSDHMLRNSKWPINPWHVAFPSHKKVGLIVTPPCTPVFSTTISHVRDYYPPYKVLTWGKS